MGLFKKKTVERTFIDGAESKLGELPVPRPADSPAPGPSQAETQELPNQPEGVKPECGVCRDYGWYCDTLGVCHNCPRCNPKSLKNPIQKIERIEQDTEEENGDYPKPKSNLYLFRSCKNCGTQVELHRFKKKWTCSKCKSNQEV